MGTNTFLWAYWCICSLWLLLFYKGSVGVRVLSSKSPRACVWGVKLDDKWVSALSEHEFILDGCDGLLMVEKRSLNYGWGELGFD